MRKRSGPALACAAWLSATAAMAQTWLPAVPETVLSAPARATSSVTTVAPVTVTAAASPAAVQKRTQSFVQSFAATAASLDQITRWHDPICVVVVGLVPDQAAQVRARVEEVAKAVGRSVRKPGCSQNIEIIFTADPQHVLDIVAARREVALGYYHRHQARALKAVTRPIQA